jgi:hypothetical protein
VTTPRPAPAPEAVPTKCVSCGHEPHDPGHCKHVSRGKATDCGWETFHCYCKTVALSAAAQPAAIYGGVTLCDHCHRSTPGNCACPPTTPSADDERLANDIWHLFATCGRRDGPRPIDVLPRARELLSPKVETDGLAPMETGP